MNVNFNASARTNHLKGRNKLRVAHRGDILSFRPTDRKAGANLPKGEKLIELSGGKATLPEGFEAKSGKYELQVDKYGWLSAVPATGNARGPSVQIG